MGTTYSVSLNSDIRDEFDSSIFEIFDSVNSDMSTYLESSLISKVNKTPIDQWVQVNDNFLEVLGYAQNLCYITNGVYYVSVGALVNRWGFGSDDVTKKPTDAELNFYKKEIGCDSFEINTNNNEVRRINEISLDFSSIAKGFAIDKVYSYLSNSKELKNFLVELGGEIRATQFKDGETNSGLVLFNKRSSNKGWKIGVVDPQDPKKLIYTFNSGDFDSFSMATSGDYRNIRFLDEDEFSHTINTKTGKPKSISKRSVSVIADNAMNADALATALNAMDLIVALEFANSKKIKALFLFEDEESTKILFSDALQKVKI